MQCVGETAGVPFTGLAGRLALAAVLNPGHYELGGVRSAGGADDLARVLDLHAVAELLLGVDPGESLPGDPGAARDSFRDPGTHGGQLHLAKPHSPTDSVSQANISMASSLTPGPRPLSS